MNAHPKIPDDYLDDIIRVFLLGVRTELKDEYENTIPDIIARSYPEDGIEYFPYIVEWKELFNIRDRITKILKESKNDKLINLAKALEDVHSER